MSAEITPSRLHLVKDRQLEIDWADGRQCVYTLTLLRSMCPCAQCKIVRENKDPHQLMPATTKKPLLQILPGNYSGQIVVTHAEMVGNYAIRIDWSDNHGSGIYSFQYLRDLCAPR